MHTLEFTGVFQGLIGSCIVLPIRGKKKKSHGNLTVVAAFYASEMVSRG